MIHDIEAERIVTPLPLSELSNGRFSSSSIGTGPVGVELIMMKMLRLRSPPGVYKLWIETIVANDVHWLSEPNE